MNGLLILQVLIYQDFYRRQITLWATNSQDYYSLLISIRKKSELGELEPNSTDMICRRLNHTF